jgi:hypothetical protein
MGENTEHFARGLLGIDIWFRQVGAEECGMHDKPLSKLHRLGEGCVDL